MATKSTAMMGRTSVLSATTLLSLVTGAVVLWQTGVYVDAWYHLHYNFAIESFFTWPHAMLYAGWGLTSLVVALALGDGLARGLPRGEWLPRGFALVLAGGALFGLGGAFDFIWHSLVGFEVAQEAILAPSHLWLAIAFIISAFGLAQAAVSQRRAAGRPSYRLRAIDLPIMVTIGALLRVCQWFATYGDPLSADFASGGAVVGRLPGFTGVAFAGQAGQIAGTVSILLHSLVLALLLVGPLRWLRLPGGAISIIMLYSGVLMLGATDQWLYLPAIIGAALVGEAIWAGLWRGRLGGLSGTTGYWLLGAAVPAVQFSLYLITMATMGGGIIWTAHLWAAMPIVAGLFGLTGSLLAVPPRLLSEYLPAAER